ncbi:hypothetical protein EDC14_104835 [Hydrogenispora ethanolica]|uniref:Uncharacterized protein n=1 Tax=Hydrogenispora ethanolica TaxID=1082276 RepID=A0A4V2QBL8_HYDET|nr:hypothetical protein EDC14_104835 [Hydrogenispora ethanolica]
MARSFSFIRFRPDLRPGRNNSPTVKESYVMMSRCPNPLKTWMNRDLWFAMDTMKKFNHLAVRSRLFAFFIS